MRFKGGQPRFVRELARLAHASSRFIAECVNTRRLAFQVPELPICGVSWYDSRCRSVRTPPQRLAELPAIVRLFDAFGPSPPLPRRIPPHCLQSAAAIFRTLTRLAAPNMGFIAMPATPPMPTSRLTGRCTSAASILRWLVIFSLGLSTAAPSQAETKSGDSVTFENDVMSVLSKASCNAGTCHGNVNGKGGFFLSLRGQDPHFDYRQLVQAASGRRINRIEPEKSLALAKATASVAHEGGKRFEKGSPEHTIFTQWIQQGLVGPDPSGLTVTSLEVTPTDAVLWLPETQRQLSVTAWFSDGSRRDVTRMAVYETSDPLVNVSIDGVVRFDNPGVVTILVRYLDGQFPVRLACRAQSPEFVWTAPSADHFIDDFVFARLKQLKLNPAELSSDSVFLRRVSLDLLGVLPTGEEARAFVSDHSIDKRARLVDDLLSRPEFADMWAQKWSDLVRNEEKTLDATGVERLHAWMRQRFADDVPIDQFVSDLIASRGSTYENPPANYWRAHREPFVRAETTAQIFLGVRLQCAKCHNHPFDHWSQDEYYQWSSVFEGVDYEIVDNNRRDKLDSHEFVGDQIVKVAIDKNVNNARTGAPATPKFLGSDDVVQGDRLKQLADWLTRPDNRRFAEAQANRIWYHLMGIGLVDPVDDLRLTNPASHPELLDALTDELIASGFSLKHLVRTIVLSRTYQLASELDPSQFGENEQYDERLFARAVVRRLTAEQLLDAQSQVLGLPARFEGYRYGTRAVEIAGVERVRRKLSDGDVFLRQFGKPERLLSCECERSDDATLGQALSLVGGESLNARLSHPENRIGKLLSTSGDPRMAIESLFWTALSRAPTEQELAASVDLITQTGDARRTLEDLTWALLNAKELIFRN